MQANKVKALAALALMANTAVAQPWVLPTLDGTEGVTIPSAPTPRPKQIDARRVWEAAMACWPERSTFRLELSAVGRAGFGSAATLNQDNTVTTDRVWAGVVASIPLYSATELDRERQREYQRRTDAAKVVEELISSTTKAHTTARQVELLRAIEKRSQERVRYGVTDTAEQIAALTALVNAENSLTEHEAKAVAARLAAEATCEVGRAHLVREALR